MAFKTALRNIILHKRSVVKGINFHIVSLFHAADQKLFHFYRQTDAHFASLSARARFFFYMEIYTFHDTT